MYYLYRKDFSLNTKKNKNDFLKQCRVEVLHPGLFRFRLKIEKISWKLLLSRVYFWLITLGRYDIYYLLDNDAVVHTSYVVPKCSKFSFLKKNNYEIGPCVTNAEYRRKGSYEFMLNYITSSEKLHDSIFYMIVKDTNLASIKGIEKSGFYRYGILKKTRLFKHYKLEELIHDK